MHLDMSKIPKDLLGDQKKKNVNEDDDKDEDVENFMASNIASDKTKGEATKQQLGILKHYFYNIALILILKENG